MAIGTLAMASENLEIPNLDEIKEAHARIKSFIHQTPVITNESINTLSGASLFFKCENFQRVGAFKMRGASNAILQLTPDQLSAGVVTHSSGNHAQAVALAAKKAGAKAYIVMPTTAPKVKVNAVKEYGAEITFCEATLEARETEANRIIRERGATFIHPFDNKEVIAGQATVALELLQQVTGLDYILAPVGGGGLLSGTALSCFYSSTHTTVIAGEPQGADDAYRSLQAGHLIPSTNPQTIADGLLTSLSPRTFEVIKKHVKEIITVGDDEILKAMYLIMERSKLVVEPSAAVPLAAVLKRPDIFKNKKVGLILSGGNIDLSSLTFSQKQNSTSS